MMERFAYRLNRDDKPLGKSELIATAGDADVLVPTVDDRIDDEVLALAVPAATIEGEKVIINIKTFAAGTARPIG